MSKSDSPLNYGDYLQLERLLACQAPESDRVGRPAHDETLFIIVHQAYELWFKQILYELDAVQAVFAGPRVEDSDIGRAAHGLARVVEIQKLLIQQLDVLETMTPLDFLDFRDLLVPASGFQSLQFRLLETRLGLRREARLNFDAHAYDERLKPAERERLRAAESEPALATQLEAWLARTPFVDMAGYDFHDAYRAAVADMLARDAETLRSHPTIGEQARTQEIEGLKAAQSRFDALFDEAAHAALQADGLWRFSAPALQAALFVMLYRDEPALQLPFRLLGLIMDLDESMTTWRYRHALMVQRMIGRKVGTGGSSGHDYLRQTAEQHRVFGDLFALSTYLIPRSRLPALPEEVRRAMSYRYATDGP